MNRVEREALLRRLRRDAERIAAHFGLEYLAIEAERRGVKARYGACYSDGLIKIRLQHAKTGEPLRYSSLIDTLCHELAHLKHFDHGKDFKRLYLRILRWARRQGIYRPRSRRPLETPLPPARQHAPERRNGVPVFASPPDPARRPSWMQAMLGATKGLAGQASSPVPGRRPEAPVISGQAVPRRSAPSVAAKGEALPLFSGLADAAHQRPTKRRRSAGDKKREVARQEARQRQLTLF